MKKISSFLKDFMQIFAFEKLTDLPASALAEGKKDNFFKMVFKTEKLQEFSIPKIEKDEKIQPSLFNIIFSNDQLPELETRNFTGSNNLAKIIFSSEKLPELEKLPPETKL